MHANAFPPKGYSSLHQKFHHSFGSLGENHSWLIQRHKVESKNVNITAIYIHGKTGLQRQLGFKMQLGSSGADLEVSRIN